MREINETSYSQVSVQEINNQAKNNPEQLVEQSELYYYTQLHNAADRIVAEKRHVVLLSGPSASGKTTTAHKLKKRLTQLGVGAKVLSMDDFFLGINHYPILENGKPDMESILALDIPLLNQCFEELLSTGVSEFPIFDFESQSRSSETRTMKMGKDDVLIMEGIHALNPAVLQNIARSEVFHFYVSVRTKFMSHDENILKPRDIRLLRRMVRDYLFRNYSAVETIRYWDHVVQSEKINIDPYRDDVDLKMDTTLDYEVCVWHNLLDQHLQGKELKNVRQFAEMETVIAGLNEFAELGVESIPEKSLLREFIGKV